MVVPEYELLPDNSHVPAPALVTATVPRLSEMMPEKTFAPVLVPPSVKVLVPAREADAAPENVSAPVPLFVIVPPPVVPWRS